MRGTRWTLWIVALRLAGSMADAPAAGQLAVRGLLDLGHGAAPARYSPGSLDRAAHAQERFALLAESFARWSGRGTPLPLVVLAPEEWSRAGLSLPVGLAETTSAGELVLPAWGDAATVALWTRLLGSTELAGPGGDPVRGTRVESASLGLADLTGQLEGSRLLLDRSGLRFAPAGCADLVAALVARAAFGRYETARLPELRRVFGQLARRIEGPLPVTETGSLEADRRMAAWARLYLAADAGVGAGDAGRMAQRLLRQAGERQGPLLLGEVWMRLQAGRAVFEREFVAAARH